MAESSKSRIQRGFEAARERLLKTSVGPRLTSPPVNLTLPENHSSQVIKLGNMDLDARIATNAAYSNANGSKDSDLQDQHFPPLGNTLEWRSGTRVTTDQEPATSQTTGKGPDQRAKSLPSAHNAWNTRPRVKAASLPKEAGDVEGSANSGGSSPQLNDAFTEVHNRGGTRHPKHKASAGETRDQNLFQVLAEEQETDEEPKLRHGTVDSSDKNLHLVPVEEVVAENGTVQPEKNEGPKDAVKVSDSQSKEAQEAVAEVELEEEPHTPKASANEDPEEVTGEVEIGRFPIVVRSPTKWADAGDDDEDIAMAQTHPRGMKGRPVTDQSSTPDKGNAVKKRILGGRGTEYQRMETFTQLMPRSTGENMLGYDDGSLPHGGEIQEDPPDPLLPQEAIEPLRQAGEEIKRDKPLKENARETLQSPEVAVEIERAWNSHPGWAREDRRRWALAWSRVREVLMKHKNTEQSELPAALEIKDRLEKARSRLQEDRTEGARREFEEALTLARRRELADTTLTRSRSRI
ncbi:hypothetical protein R1sor_004764 [Riccia sorocarpa]|uniref:Uncharacterized protein n=1 Tax=Riccia sorocarpa TaxID=122646 RepID=A0ABD3HHL3_9MARC